VIAAIEVARNPATEVLQVIGHDEELPEIQFRRRVARDLLAAVRDIDKHKVD
jgi:hypothetical protein